MAENERSCSNSGCSKESCAGCSHAKEQKTSFLEPTMECNSIKKVIGVVSGKGGVGKSLVTSLMAVSANRRGYRSAILDADITGLQFRKPSEFTEERCRTAFIFSLPKQKQASI